MTNRVKTMEGPILAESRWWPLTRANLKLEPAARVGGEAHVREAHPVTFWTVASSRFSAD